MKIFLILAILTVGLFSKDYALFIGIDNYQDKNLPKLYGAKNDAIALSNIFKKMGINNITILLNKNATKNNIVKTLKNIEKNIKSGDRFIFFYAGHGESLENIAKISNLKIKNTAILLPYDFNISNIKSYIITHRDLVPIFKKIDNKVSQGLLVFDSCFSEYAYRNIDSLQPKGRYQTRNGKLDIKLDLSNYQFKMSNLDYPYRHIISLTSSKADEPSKEDKILKRGVFSMAFESCLQSYKKITINNLKECLDNRFFSSVYSLNAPKTLAKSILFKWQNELYLKKSSKISIQSNLLATELKELKDIAIFKPISSNINDDFILTRSSGKYLLRVLPTMLKINSFNNLKELKNYLLSYRLIKIDKSVKNDIKITLLENGKKQDSFKTNTNITINISSKTKGYLALFSLDKEGNLYLIEPYNNYKEFKGNLNIYAKTGKKEGIDFLKAFIFSTKNNLTQIKLNQKTGKILNIQKNIDKILNIIKKANYSQATLQVRVYKGQK